MGAQGGVEYSEDVPDKNSSHQRHNDIRHRAEPRANRLPLLQQGGFSNTIRRSRNQFLYVVPPLVAAYWLMEWANERNHYLNCKAGRALFEQEG
ncbi:unnamed protein product [Zymoseptoria tritici ST99CH_1A5]|uniref:Cytochrome b-c1 complex subunit 8 n=1 Tax=Zymoseptoria tritici ST99CH_1A5 TaxID=1276529 RepID=A0A1Y6L6T6_ZYMTR|nr:unnamed protein product [Zymoseptoria tritici ST99CH_1A5]